MTQTSPPGWHPDPAGPTPGQPPLLRWWDGTAWTEHLTPAYPPGQPFGQPFGQTSTQPFVQPFVQPYAAAPGPTTPDGEPLAGWWRRALAYLLDGVVVGIAGNLVSLPAQADLQRDVRDLSEEMQRRLDANPDDTGAIGDYFHGFLDTMHDHAVSLLVPALVVGVLYFGVLLRWKGATLGMLAAGLRVRLRERPGTLPWTAIAIRVGVQVALVNLLILLGLGSGSVVLLVLLALGGNLFQLLNYLWPLWDPKRQALHDKAARTNVVRVR
ncbi:RDD family protein [Nocardioides sp. CER19]|uniref:RDD family protein n=1 Tax=Nocardioides sp. CER19 TaxID=3038538 RepID=UPI00244C69C7|nr:RDD family protein [Nocardioides sp. CER19]MDH2416041.1 RDD family protein [Nocardioides sp. CER19]